MVPEAMRGVWQRRSIAIDDRGPSENAHVLWLQGAEAFADLRVPHSPAEGNGAGRVEAFAGATSWDPPRLTWLHAVDWNGGFSDYDCGVVEWQAGALVERGTFDDDAGTTHVYEEVWDRIDPGDHYIALASGSAMIVEVGPYALAMRDGRPSGATFDVRAARWSADGGWQDTYAFGAGRDLPLAHEATMRADWSVTESAPTPAPR